MPEDDIPYYEKIHNDYKEGWITRKELDEMCAEDEVLRQWIEHYDMLEAALKELNNEILPDDL